MHKLGSILAILMFHSVALGATEKPIAIERVTYSDIDDDFYQEQYRTLRAAVERALPVAAATVFKSDVFSKSLGLPMTYHLRAPLRIDIRVIPEESLYHGLAGTAGWEQADDHWVHVLTLNIAGFMQNPQENIQAIVSHEFAHVVLADVVGVEGSAVVPMWLNEGIAQSVTDEGHQRVLDLVKIFQGAESMLRPCALDSPVDTFAHGEGNFECYPEYYVAMRRLVQIGGPRAIGRLLKELGEHHSEAQAFQTATDKDYSTFQEQVDATMSKIVLRQEKVP